MTAQNNAVINVTTGGTSYSTYGIYYATFAVGNTVSTAKVDLYNCNKYANNLTYDCTTAFTAGTGVGYNN